LLSVLTLNLWHDAGPWKTRAARIRDWIDRLDPDLIGFQEALRGETTDQVRELLGDRAYHCDYVCASPFWRDPANGAADSGPREFGNAIASRWPIASRETLALPDAGDGETRAALSVTIDSPHGALSITCTHLHWKYRHGAVRERQVEALCDLALRRRPREGFPPILVGDFNAEPESAEIRYVCGLQSLGGRSVAFLDAWRVAGESGPGHTWCNRNAYAAEALEPDRRIDYVFTGFPQRGTGIGRIEGCRVVCDAAEDGIWPSDHFGVYAELRTQPLTGTPS
jgi:endonuclease/exonuclease/phosphatase family metal-dependent hydrolase